MKRMGLAKKLIIAVCIICLAFIVAFISMQAVLFQDALQTQQTERLEADGYAAQDYIHLYMQQLKNLTISAALQPDIQRGEASVTLPALERFVEQSVDKVHFAYFVNLEGKVFCSRAIYYRVLEITMDYDLPAQIAHNTPRGLAVSVSLPYRSSMSTESAVAFSRTTYDQSNRPSGTVLLEVDLENASRALQSAINLRDHSFMVVSQDGCKIFGVQRFPLADETAAEITSMRPGWARFSDSQGSYRAFSSKATDNEWRVILILNETSLFEPIRDMIQRLTIISVAFLAALTFAISVLVRHFIAPVKRLAGVMNDLNESDLSLPEHLDLIRGDEIGDLTRAFQSMLSRIKRLMQRQHETEQAQMRSEIRALQNQLRPHFLYNTLNSISSLVAEGQADKVPAAISALIHLLAMCTDKTDAIITLEDELRTARYYLDIMKLRYGSRFETAIQIPGELLGCAVPKLVLQPLIENAIFHGLHTSTRCGMVAIEASAQGDIMTLSVMDDGDGIPQELLEQLLAGEGEAHSTGLKNTHSRIQLYFGEQYGLRIRSMPGVGTCVEAVLPRRSLEAVKTALE